MLLDDSGTLYQETLHNEIIKQFCKEIYKMLYISAAKSEKIRVKHVPINKEMFKYIMYIHKR